MSPGQATRIAGAAPGTDPLEQLARRIVEDHRDRLPDLTSVTLLRPRAHGDARLRRLLLAAAREQGVEALLGPRITSLRQWVMEQDPSHGAPLLGDHGRELMLFEALREHPQLFERHDTWRLVDTLLALFRELTLSGATPPAAYESFVHRLREAYGLGGNDSACLEPLGREARIVHTLWHAWLEQQRQEGREDPDAHYLRALASLEPGNIPPGSLYAAGYDELLPAETALLNGLTREGRLHWLVGLPAAPGMPQPTSDGADPQTPFSAFLDQVFDTDGAPLRDRALAFAVRHPTSPATPRLALLGAEDAEAQAVALDIRIRAWLLEGHRHIGVVTDDRRLARRLRALLERAGIDLDDPGGWALSTTRAAAALERWLEALEEDFEYQPLMDVLKSPFVFPDRTEEHLFAVYRLEQDVMLRENIPRNLARMREHLLKRARRLGPASERSTQAVSNLLDALEEAALPLRDLIRGAARPAGEWLTALQESLHRLGMQASLEADPAGRRLLEEVRAMAADLGSRPMSMDWREFRTWLGRVLETRHFRPHPRPAPVRLMSLGETALARFDALIIAAADREHLPGHEPARALFNDGVRHALGLEAWHDRVARQQGRFRRLLEAAPRVLITWQRERDGGPQRPAPWVELIDAFHRLAWGTPLRDESLEAWLKTPNALVQSPDTAPLPATPQRPAPLLPAAHVPAKLSASAHQDLIDCPYRFYAARGLGLAPPEELAEALSKADYGERVHLCLQAFHGGTPELPGPWQGPLDEAHRAEAQALLEAISKAVFEKDLEDNFMHRGWLARWRALIPAYLDWAIERAEAWRVQDTEVSREVALATGAVLKGRLDRVDASEAGQGVIDYKTGTPPAQKDVDAGEAVQLPTYALLLEDSQRVEYLHLDRDKVKSGASLEGEALTALREAVATRLLQLLERLRAGSPMPAWGDEKACQHCSMDVVCRRGSWEQGL
ncbi:PD-(D/E)XK nuclease family protein [Thioalkalivibrio sulfidiphilus]|uniref:PD-(D/E)XK nuclease family protein n=1 Tax=Thioalkalivibrio sulfidiphilus TaxID=1033854 RepID=UPI00037F187E|nr:PD-(D/E)XK nuclease family protein [Thioalkalivibrio sulfidiphilus]